MRVCGGGGGNQGAGVGGILTEQGGEAERINMEKRGEEGKTRQGKDKMSSNEGAERRRRGGQIHTPRANTQMQHAPTHKRTHTRRAQRGGRRAGRPQRRRERRGEARLFKRVRRHVVCLTPGEHDRLFKRVRRHVVAGRDTPSPRQLKPRRRRSASPGKEACFRAAPQRLAEQKKVSSLRKES